MRALCSKCEERPVLASGLCKSCYDKADYQKHREARIQKQRDYHAANRSIVLERQRAYREKNREELAARKAEWQRENKANVAARNARWKACHRDQVNASQRRRYASDPARGVARARRYQLEYPHTKREIDHRRRARLKGRLVLPIDAMALYRRERGLCHLCKRPVPFAEMSLDHVVPLAHGGAHSMTNLRISHRVCNVRRGARGPGQPLLL